MQMDLVQPCHLAGRTKISSHKAGPITARPLVRFDRQRTITAFALATKPKTAKVQEKQSEEVEEEEEEEFDDLDSPDEASALTTQQVRSLANVICEDTEIAEIQVQMGGFGLKLRRKIGGADATPTYVAPMNGSQPAPYIEQAFQSTASMDENQIQSQEQKQQASNNGHMSSTDEDDHDENLIFLGAPKVGVLRRHRFIKGKKVGKTPLVEEGARVKKGQLLAFIEQLGTHVPVEAPQAGEIVSFECDEGSAVEYKEVIIEMAPFFGGHIIGDRKHA